MDTKITSVVGGIGGVVGVVFGPTLLKEGRFIELIALAIFGTVALAFAMWLWAPGREFTKEEVDSFLETKKKKEPRKPFEYERYSHDELMDVYQHIDRSANPERFQKLQTEIERRKAEQNSAHNSGSCAS